MIKIKFFIDVLNVFTMILLFFFNYKDDNEQKHEDLKELEKGKCFICPQLSDKQGV